MNNKTYYKVVKLKTGEIIICATYKDYVNFFGEPCICIIEPLILIPLTETKRGGDVLAESFSLRPWIGISDSDEFYIPTDIILTIGSQKQKIKEQYKFYVDKITAAKQVDKNKQETEEALMQLLNDVTMGNLHFVDDLDVFKRED